MTTLEVPVWLLHILVFLAIPGIAYLAEGISLLFEEAISLAKRMRGKD